MGKQTAISWTDATFNPWWGCTEQSPGCDNCYARVFSERPIHKKSDGSIGALHVWGKDAPRKPFGEKHWGEPLAWNRAAKAEGKRRRVFAGSMCDILDINSPDGAREQLWDLADITPNLIWLFLTKLPHRYLKFGPSRRRFRHDNVMFGTTAENQEWYDKRTRYLADAGQQFGVPTFISYEPALGPVTMKGDLTILPTWMIFGGETGIGFRPCQTLWAYNMNRECEELGVAFWMKQLSGRNPAEAASIVPVTLGIRQYPKRPSIELAA